MRHITKTEAVEAFRLPKGVALTLVIGGKTKHAVAGDWLTVAGSPNRFETMSDGEFNQRFEPAVVPAVEPPAPARRRPWPKRGGKKPGPRAGKKAAAKGPGRRVATRTGETPAGRVRSVGGTSVRSLPSEAKRETCRKLYEGGMELTAIAAKEGVKYHTLYGWKTNGEWERN